MLYLARTMKGLSKKTTIKTGPPAHRHAKVMIIYTGGTFGMRQNKEGSLEAFDFNHTLEYLPVLKRIALSITVISFLEPVDSSNINPTHWQRIAQVVMENYEQQDGFVVLHGTDTMAYSASALSFMLGDLNKSVIFTGAQLPVNNPRSDARDNLVAALEIASAYRDGKAIVPEVSLYFNYELHRGCRAKKTQSLYFDTFYSGNYPVLAKVGTSINYTYNFILPSPNKKEIALLSRFDQRIAILKLFPGIHQSYVQAVLEIPELQGLIVETYGQGNTLTEAWFVSLIKQAVQKNVLVLNISQCLSGRVIQGKYKAGKWLKDVGVVSGEDMTIEAASTKLMLLLGEYGVEGAKKRIGISLAGEIGVAST